jgi:hypothetical protein
MKKTLLHLFAGAVMIAMMCAILSLNGCSSGVTSWGGGGGGSTSSSILVTGVVPADGTSGTLCTISGLNFGASRGSRDNEQSYVSFVLPGGGAETVTLYLSWNNDQIQCAIPEGVMQRQTYAVVVTRISAAGSESSSSTPIPANSVFVQAPVVIPAVTAVTPDPVNSGGTITIEGSGFGGDQGSSYIGFVFGDSTDIQTTTISWSDTQVRCALPAGVLGEVGIYVHTDAGGNSNHFSITVNP